MTSVAEVVISAKPQGVDDVESDMQRLEDTTNETAESLDETGAELGGLSRKFRGAMTAIIAGLAVGVAGVLSKVPVLGQAMDGLAAIFTALGFQVDKKLRPFISSLSQEFFELANAIFAGNYKKAKNELGDIFALFASINFTDLIKRAQDFAGKALGFVITQITQFANSLTVADITAFTSKIIQLTKRGLRVLINAADWSAFIISMITLLGKAVVARQKAVKQEIVDPLVGYIEDNWEDWLDSAIELGKDLIDKLVKGVKNNASKLANEVEKIELAAGVTIGDVTGTIGAGADAAGNAANETSDFIGSVGNGSTKIFLDGRQVNEQVGRVRKDVLNRRG